MSDHSDGVDGEFLLDQIKATINELEFKRDYGNYLLGLALDRFEEIGIPENMAYEVAGAINATRDFKAVVRADMGAVYVIPKPSSAHWDPLAQWLVSDDAPEPERPMSLYDIILHSRKVI